MRLNWTQSIVLLAAWITGPAFAAPVTPKGAERAAILDTLRVQVSKELKTRVEFVVEKIVVSGNWAFVIATPQGPNGQQLNWSQTVCSGDVSHLAGGLMMRVGEGWDLVASALCPTDVAWATWPSDYGAPQELFEP